MAELQAANKLYEEQQWAIDAQLREAREEVLSVRDELEATTSEFQRRLDEALRRAADAEQAAQRAEADRLRTADMESLARRAEAESRQEAQVAAEAAKLAQQELCEKSSSLLAAEAKAAEVRSSLEAALRDGTDAAEELAASRARTEELRKQLGVAWDSSFSANEASKALREQLAQRDAELAETSAVLTREAERRQEVEAEVRAAKAESALLGRALHESQAREEQMHVRWAELDVFKLDVIARELKAIGRQIDALKSDAKQFQEATRRFSNHSDGNVALKAAMGFNDLAGQLRGAIKDVIERCLSETQKLHVGAPLRDFHAAGRLVDGGRMAGYVLCDEGQDSSRLGPGAQARQEDEVRRELSSQCR